MIDSKERDNDINLNIKFETENILFIVYLWFKSFEYQW